MDKQMKGALSDITVLDMTRVLSGPFAGTWLGEMGANVIKIEIPKGGDESRRNPPFNADGSSAFNTTLNRNKRSITLDLKSEEGKEIFRTLVKQADVVLENFRPDVMDRLGRSHGFGALGALSQIWGERDPEKVLFQYVQLHQIPVFQM